MAHQLGTLYDTPDGGVNVNKQNAEEYRKAAVDAVITLAKIIGIPQKLLEIGAREEDLRKLAERAYEEVFASGNPMETTVEDILEIYKKAFK